ncbi:hypothetical protein DY000_02004142 [Brassica cretica]|uniref:PX domain-containing protein n=2 Tax=Brassica cretica TaxID=69181 RepID=A0ABQ7CGT6_BRACR|nr:hypothetical protein DY000_02004142 [Brassica cretica]
MDAPAFTGRTEWLTRTLVMKVIGCQMSCLKGELRLFTQRGFPPYVDHSPARLGRGPLHPGGLYLGWGQGPTPSTAFDDRMDSSLPPGVEPGSMTIGPQGPYQPSYHIPVSICFLPCRYSNFERLHRRFEENRNYNLLLPPKHILSSSTEDAFVHRHCIQLEKYLQDLLSIDNVAVHNEVWDFLSTSSKNYSLGESSLWMRPNVIEVIMNLADKVFQLSRGGLLRKKTFTAWKKLILLMTDAVDDWFLKKIHRLRNEDTVAHGIRWFQDVKIKFCGQMAYSLPEWMTVKRHWIRLIQMADQLGGEMVVKPSSFEQQLEAGASKFKKFLLPLDASTKGNRYINSCLRYLS